MNTDLNCLSVMELWELREGPEDATARQHLDGCRRCRALLNSLPAGLDLTGAGARTQAEPAHARARPAVESELRSGTLWRAAAPADAEISWIVAVIGRSPDAPDQLLVAPVSAPGALATDSDLILDASALGYEAFVDMTNLGTVLDHQLLEAAGRLEPDMTQALVALYRHVMAGAPKPADVRLGLAALDERDPRLLEQAARADALLALWRPALELVDDPAEAPASDERTAAVAAAVPQSPALSQVLAGHLDGPQAEWDRSTLLEEAGVDGRYLDAFLADRLELTDKGDVRHLARVLRTLGVSRDQAESSVLITLARSPGGSRSAEGPTVHMAARSPAGADPETTTRDLYADLSSVDDSSPARQREITMYLAELVRELDELD